MDHITPFHTVCSANCCSAWRNVWCSSNVFKSCFQQWRCCSKNHQHSSVQRWYLLCHSVSHVEWEHQSNVQIQGLSHCATHGPSQSHLLILTHRHWSRSQHGKNMAFDCHLQFLSSLVGTTGTGVGSRRKGLLSPPDLRYIHASSIHPHQRMPSNSMASSLVEMRHLWQMSYDQTSLASNLGGGNAIHSTPIDHVDWQVEPLLQQM